MQPLQPQPPRADTGAVARFYSALAGGVHTTAADRARAAAAEARTPGSGDQVRAAREFHARVAEWAVVQEGARGVIVGEAGYPGRPDPHVRALAAAPGARAVYADPGEEVTDVNAEVFGADPRVTVCRCRRGGRSGRTVRDPEALLACPEVAGLPRPWCLLLCLAAHFWPDGEAAAVMTEYRRLLPPGSVLALSLCAPGPRPPERPSGRALADAACAPVYRHSPEAVTGWLEGAGMVIAGPGVQDVRSWPHPPWAEEAMIRRPWRIIEGVALVPRGLAA